LQNVVTYDVVVSVDYSDLTLKPGMMAAGHIATDQRDDVLQVPSEALRYAPVSATGTATRQSGKAALSLKLGRRRKPGSGCCVCVVVRRNLASGGGDRKHWIDRTGGGYSARASHVADAVA
jgi:hypothetical protein